MFFNFEIDYKRSVYGDNSKSYIKFSLNSKTGYILVFDTSCFLFLVNSIPQRLGNPGYFYG